MKTSDYLPSPVSVLKLRPRLFHDLRRGYTGRDAVSDGLAGLTVGLIALPLALALGVASLGNAPDLPLGAPAIGIFTAIIGGAVAAFFSGSRVQVSGPTAAFVTIVLLIVEQHGFDGLLLATLMAGVILILMGLTGFGSLVKYIPYPVTSGFTTGIAVAIMLGQAPGFFGLTADASVPREFAEKVTWLGEHAATLNPVSLAIGTLSALLIFFWPRWTAGRAMQRLPGAVIAVVSAAALIAVTGWDQTLGVATIGTQFGADAITPHFPAFRWPEISLDRIRDLIGPATTIAVLGAIESLLSAVVSDGLINDRHDSNTELVAQGLANLASPLFCGLPVTGAIARTSANVKAGARSPLASLVHCVALAAIVLFLAPLARFVPIAALAAVLVMVALRMGEWHELQRLRRMPTSDALVLLTTFALTVIFDLVIAVEIGMVLAAVLFIRRMAETTEVSLVTTHDELETPEQIAHGKDIPEGVLVYRIFGPFFFGAAEKMEDALQRTGTLPRVLILRLQLVPAMDATALNALESITERMQRRGGTVILSGPHHQPLAMMKRAGFIDRLGRANIRAHFDDALTRAREVLAHENPTSP